MTAALVGMLEGLQVLLVEKTDQVGGTTAFSSGAVWIPGNPQQASIGISGDMDAARKYLDALVGCRAERPLREMFLAAGPEMLRYLEERTDVRFTVYRHHPDYRQDLPGAAQGGRPLEPLPFDGRTLGKNFDRVRAPLPELMVWGGMMVTRGRSHACCESLGPGMPSSLARNSPRVMRATGSAIGEVQGWSWAMRLRLVCSGICSTVMCPSGSTPGQGLW